MKHFKALTYAMAMALVLIPGCASNQHLVFFTNSSIGVDISSEPETATPLKFVVGYKRQEGVIDPIGLGYQFHPAENKNLEATPTNSNAPVLVTKAGYFAQKGTAAKPHSVIAKMNFGATGGGAGASAAQWFATGDAAEILAGQPGIAGAISGDAKVNESAKIVALAGTDRIAREATLSSVYENIKEYIAENGPAAEDAKKIIEKVDRLDGDECRQPFERYQSISGGIDISTYPSKRITQKEFKHCTSYISVRKESLAAATKEAKKSDLKKSDGSPLGKTERDLLIENIRTYPKRIEELSKLIGGNPDVLEMIEFYYKNILLTNK